MLTFLLISLGLDLSRYVFPMRIRIQPAEINADPEYTTLVGMGLLSWKLDWKPKIIQTAYKKKSNKFKLLFRLIFGENENPCKINIRTGKKTLSDQNP